MSNPPRPPRPPRPGAAPRPAAPAPSTAPSTGGASDFGDTRTVVLSRKSMGMHQRKSGEDEAPAATSNASKPSSPAATPEPQLKTAKVVNGEVFCVSCSSSFPIVSDEFYGAVVECPDCSAEFVIPAKSDVPAASAPTPAASAPAPAASAPAPAASAPKSNKQKRKPVRNIPDWVSSEVPSDSDVVYLKTATGSGGAGTPAVVSGAIALVGGVVGAVLGGGLGIGIAAGLGIVGIAAGFVMAGGSGKKRALALTEEKAYVIAGDFVAEADLD